MKFLKNLFLYFSAFIPLFFLLAVKLLVDILNNNLTWNFLNTFTFCLLCTFIALGTIGILWSTIFNRDKIMQITVVSAQDITDKYFLQYFSLFVMFAIPLDISYFNEFFIFLIILIFIAIVYINCGLYFINPLLNILGFKFYDTTYINQNGEQKTAKIFSKKTIFANQKYKVKIKNEHFAFISKDKN